MYGIAALTAAYVLSQFFRSFLAVLTPALGADLGATKADLSQASGAWFVVFALAQFGVGMALDRFGPRRTAAILLAVGGGGGSVLFASAGSPHAITAAMGLIGLGCAPVLMAAFFLFARNFPPARFAFLGSTMVGVGNLGNVVGAAPLAAAAETFGWRPVMLALGLIALAVAGAIMLFVKDPPRAEGHAGLSGFGELLRLRTLWPLIPLTALNYAPVAGIRGLWAGPYLNEAFGADALTIGNATLGMALAMVAGNLAYGPLDRLFNSRKWVVLAGNSVVLAVLTALVFWIGAGIWVSALAMAVIGLFGSSYALLMAHARAFIPPHLTGRGVTLMNFYSIGGVGLMQLATGTVVSSASMPTDPLAAWRALMIFYAVTLGLALLAYLFSRDAKPEL